MKKYIVNIGGTSNLSSDPNFFIGTGFMGEGFDTHEELKSLLKKYATYQKDGKAFWRSEIKMTFSLGTTLEAFRAEGDRQCKENGFVNLFTAALACKSDPFRGIEIIYRPSKWVDKDGNEFAFILIKGDEVIPQSKKLSEILKEIGMYSD